MKFLCLAYYDEKKFETLGEAELAAIGRACQPFDDELRQSGQLLQVASLAATKDSTSLRPRGGKVTVTDGPFAETKEQLLGFYLVDAADLDDVLAIARDLATVNPGGTYEIRPVRAFFPDQRTDQKTGT